MKDINPTLKRDKLVNTPTHTRTKTHSLTYSQLQLSVKLILFVCIYMYYRVCFDDLSLSPLSLSSLVVGPLQLLLLYLVSI